MGDWGLCPGRPNLMVYMTCIGHTGEYSSIPFSQAIWCFCCLAEGVTPTKTLSNELKLSIRKSIGTFANPYAVILVHSLPKTYSGKIMRRVLKKVCSFSLKFEREDGCSKVQDHETGDPGVSEREKEGRIKKEAGEKERVKEGEKEKIRENSYACMLFLCFVYKNEHKKYILVFFFFFSVLRMIF